MSLAKNLSTILLACTVVFACNRPDASKEGTSSSELKLASHDEFSLKLPKYLSPITTLHEDASLQYQNTVKEVYVIVIDEPKATLDSVLVANQMTESYPTNFEGYANMVRDQFAERVSVETEIEVKPLKSGSGLEMKYFEADASVDNIDIHYIFGLAAYKEKYYQIVTWTLQSRKDKYAPDMLAIVKSFSVK
jgi:hypothetical protein